MDDELPDDKRCIQITIYEFCQNPKTNLTTNPDLDDFDRVNGNSKVIRTKLF